MAESQTQSASFYNPIRAPRGATLSCKGWQQEAALRLLMNSLDPAIAEHPEELVVSGGIGKLARDWPAFRAIVNSLQTVEHDETLIIHCGEPGPVLKTNPEAPRVLAINPASAHPSRMPANWMFTGPSSALPETYEVLRFAARKHFGGSLAGRLVAAGGMGGMGGAQPLAASLNGAAFLGVDADADRIKRRVKTGYCEVMVNDLDEALRILKNAVRKREPASVGLIGNASELLPEFVRRGVLPDLLTDQTPADDPLAYIPQGLTATQAGELREQDPRAYRERALDSIATHVRAMLELRKTGAVVFEFGNGIRAQAAARGVSSAYEIPDFVSEYLQPDLAQGRGPLTIVALSGDPDDIAQVDALFPELFPDSDLRQWSAIARRYPSPGLPTRSFWMTPSEAIKLSTAINDLVARGKIRTPAAIGLSIRPKRSSVGPNALRETGNSNSAVPSQTPADWPGLPALLEAARGAAWFSAAEIAGPTEATEQGLSFIVVADGKPDTARCIPRLFATHSQDSALSI
jgi:urocanate hydratase